jgi:DNA-binding transcriptional ArsR family regulator
LQLYQVAEADFLYLKKWGFTQGNLSWHLAKLAAAGYVIVKKSFKGKYPMAVCRLTKTGVKRRKAMPGGWGTFPEQRGFERRRIVACMAASRKVVR